MWPSIFFFVLQKLMGNVPETSCPMIIRLIFICRRQHWTMWCALDLLEMVLARHGRWASGSSSGSSQESTSRLTSTADGNYINPDPVYFVSFVRFSLENGEIDMFSLFNLSGAMLLRSTPGSRRRGRTACAETGSFGTTTRETWFQEPQGKSPCTGAAIVNLVYNQV